MVMVLGMIVLLSVLAVALIDVMQGEASRSRTEVKRDTAYQAAEAGVDEYISKLIDDRLYYVHFVHPGEATRQSTASGRLVAAEATWQQADGNSWTYPRGKDTWYGAAQLGNGYEYNLEIVPPIGGAADDPHRLDGAAGRRHRRPRLARARDAGAPVVGLRLPDGRRRRHHVRRRRDDVREDLCRHRRERRRAQRPARRHGVRRHLRGGQRHRRRRR